MGSNQYQIYGNGHEEEHEFEEGDTDTPTHRNGSFYVNGIGNGNENGKEDSFLLSKLERDNEDHEAGGASENSTQNDPFTPRSTSGRLLTRTFRDGGGGRSRNGTKRLKLIEENEESGTKEEQAEFLKELEAFYKERRMDFKPPKFYGVPLNCLKLWRSVVRLGGYDRITTYKLWRQVGESFHPPKTCTTVSWTFRTFYEKSLLEYERHKREIGDLELLEFPEDTLVENENKSTSTAQKREKYLKNIGVKQKKHDNSDIVEHEIHEANNQSMVTILDVGPPADWVKINVRESKDCFEVYALVPGLLREEVRVQSDPAGRLVITGQPEQLDNPWGITPFRKVVKFPVRIDPLHTSAVVSLHGRLFVRVPFDRSNT